MRANLEAMLARAAGRPLAVATLVLVCGLVLSTLAAAATSKPVILGFTPKAGKPGSSVAITGKNLRGAKAVRFGGTGATFTVVTPTLIVAKVPRGARTGRISVTTKHGVATSRASFKV